MSKLEKFICEYQNDVLILQKIMKAIHNKDYSVVRTLKAGRAASRLFYALFTASRPMAVTAREESSIRN